MRCTIYSHGDTTRARNWPKHRPISRHIRTCSTNGPWRPAALPTIFLYGRANILSVLSAQVGCFLLPNCQCVHCLQAALVTTFNPEFHSLVPVNDIDLKAHLPTLLHRRHVSKPSGALVPLRSFADRGCISMPSRSVFDLQDDECRRYGMRKGSSRSFP